MGNARWSQSEWTAFSSATQQKSREEIFTSRTLDESLDPSKIKFRESVDSEANPESTPIILAADETGSMGELAEIIIKTGLGTIMESIYDRKPVTDPHIMCMGIGDAYVDHAPLQVTQFEASVKPLVEQVQKIWIEGNGGGNGGESYSLAWWFATFKTKCDAAAKRGRKGYLFTIGDESPHDRLTCDQIRKIMGVGCERDVQTRDLLKSVQQYFHVFHLIVKPVADQDVVGRWRALLGERAITVSDHTKLAEGIVSVIQVVEGHDPSTVAGSWSHETALVVRDVVGQIAKA
jgi:hypothetical protein